MYKCTEMIVAGAITVLSCLKFLLVFVLAWVIVPITNASETDPMCGSSALTAQWGKSNAPIMERVDTHLALAASKLPRQSDNLVSSLQLLTGASLSVLWHKSTQRTVDIEPIDQVNVGGTTIPILSKPAEVKRCTKAIQSLQSKAVDIKDRIYACALLDVDRKCLTSNESQPHVKDASIPFRSIAFVLVKQQAVCTGLLLDERSFKTARHCFINQVSGEQRPEFLNIASNDWSISTLDGKRKVVINKGEIEKLVVPGGFDINQDPVTISVSVAKAPDAKPLPLVKFKAPTDNNQLMWLAGPVYLLDQAIAMHRAALNPSIAPPKPNWRDSIRWSSLLGAQCRTVGVKDSCVYHSCQSFQGFSGSPMITSVVPGTGGEPDIIEYAGVHSGTPGTKKPSGWPGCTKSTADFNASEKLIFNVGNTGD